MTVLTLLQVTLVDTAGLRESADAIEVAGMQRARSAMAEADIIALVTGSPATFPEAAGSAASLAWMNTGPHEAAGTRQHITHGLFYQSSASAGNAFQSLNALLATTTSTKASCSLSPADASPILGRVYEGEETSQQEHSRMHAELGCRQQPAKLLLIHNKRDLWSPSENTAGPQGKARHPDSNAGSQTGHVCSTAGHAAASGHMSAGAAEGTPPTCSVSCKTGEGIEELLSTLGSLIRQVAGSGDSDSALITRYVDLCTLWRLQCLCYVLVLHSAGSMVDCLQ